MLTRLWNYSPDNLLACKSEERNFLPPVDAYLENSRDKNDTSLEWRALRLLARQSPHFFTFINSPSCKISDYLEAVRKRLLKDRTDAGKQLHSTTSANVNKSNTNISGNDVNNSSSNNLGSTNNSASKSNAKTNLNINEPMGSSPAPEESNIEQENNEDGELEDVGGDVAEEDENDAQELEKNDDDRNVHSNPVTANREQIEELAPLIGDDWKKLGKKLGYTLDELLYLATNNPDRNGGCTAMLVNWFADDDDANLDNLAYVMEGLEIYEAAKAVKALIEKITNKAAQANQEEDESENN